MQQPITKLTRCGREKTPLGCATLRQKAAATSGKQDVIRNFFAQLFVFKIFPAEIDLQNKTLNKKLTLKIIY